MRYGSRCVLMMTTSDGQMFSGTDNQRPELELKCFKDIYQYSDQNGESSWKLVTVYNA